MVSLINGPVHVAWAVTPSRITYKWYLIRLRVQGYRVKVTYEWYLEPINLRDPYVSVRSETVALGGAAFKSREWARLAFDARLRLGGML